MLRNWVKRCLSTLKESNEIVLFINGEKHIVSDVNPETKLIDFLRDVRNTSVKNLCKEGVCGFCTVTMQECDKYDNVLTKQVNSCRFPLILADGKHFLTSEGIKHQKQILTRIQETFENENVFQCGFCTTGVLMNIYTELLKNPDISSQELEESLVNITCRCTGYRPIIQTTQKLHKELSNINDEEIFNKMESQLIFPKELRNYTSNDKIITMMFDNQTLQYIKPLKYYVVSNKVLLNDISDVALSKTEYRSDHLFFHAPSVIFVFWKGAENCEKYKDIDAGLALQNMQLKINELGLSSCLIGFSKYAEEKIIEVCKTENEDYIIALTVGYADEDPSPPERKIPEVEFI